MQPAIQQQQMYITLDVLNDIVSKPAQFEHKFTPHYMCEHIDNDGNECDKPAVSEYQKVEVDTDGVETYYTMRCEDHPETDPEYVENPLN